MSDAVKLFYSYAHEDEELRDELEKHLSVLKRQGTIDCWHDGCISAGRELDREIEEHLESADIILLLISPDFLASEYCWGVEMTRALERHKQGVARVIPVILRWCLWEGAPFGKLAALPKDGRPVDGPDWQNRDQAFTSVAKGISIVACELRGRDVQGFVQSQVQRESREATIRGGVVQIGYYLTHLHVGAPGDWETAQSFVTVAVDNVGRKPLTLAHVVLSWRNIRPEDGPQSYTLAFSASHSGPIQPRRPIHKHDHSPPCVEYCYWPDDIPHGYSGPISRQPATCARRCGAAHGSGKSVNYDDADAAILYSAAFADPSTMTLELWAVEDEEHPIWIGKGADIIDLQFLMRYLWERHREYQDTSVGPAV